MFADKDFAEYIIEIVVKRLYLVGTVKYESLGLLRSEFCEVKDEFIQEYRNAIEKAKKHLLKYAKYSGA